MTVQDYEAVAIAVKHMKSLGDDQLYVADMLATVFSIGNPNFDRNKFMEECGVQDILEKVSKEN